MFFVDAVGVRRAAVSSPASGCASAGSTPLQPVPVRKGKYLLATRTVFKLFAGLIN